MPTPPQKPADAPEGAGPALVFGEFFVDEGGVVEGQFGGVAGATGCGFTAFGGGLGFVEHLDVVGVFEDFDVILFVV